VAIKLIQAGRDGAQVLARFESERQALAAPWRARLAALPAVPASSSAPR
jgi:hypothetical protein